MRLTGSYIARVRPVRLAALLLIVLAAVPLAGVALAQTEAPQKPLPRCFGAASRDPVNPCRNDKLKRMVFPKPVDALLEANSECKLGKRQGELTPCEFGVPVEEATETIALIGDSHAAHWRAAIDYVVADREWHGVSFTKAGCPLSTAVTDLPEPGKTKCTRFKRQLFKWFGDHPEVSTVITSNHTGGKVVGAKGRDYEAHVVGYTECAGASCPRRSSTSTPSATCRGTRSSSSDCVGRAIRKKISAGPACAVPRDYALKRDPAVPAALASDPRRVQLIDMTRFMCSSRLCMPVIGGALVHKDQTHLTRIFATTLGPYLLRHIERAAKHMGTGTRP